MSEISPAGLLPAVAVAGDAGGPQEAAVRAAFAAVGVEVVEPGYEALSRPSVVVVAGPPAGRTAVAQAAVAAGAHVFVAWPPGAVAEGEALLRHAEEAGVEVGVERPLAVDVGAGVARLVSVVAVTAGTGWPRRVAGALDVCARLAGSREATRVSAEAERDGPRLQAVAATLRFRNGAFGQVLVRAAPEASGGTGTVTVYAAGTETAAAAVSALGAEAVAFVRSVAARGAAPYSLDDALATMRLAERVLAALR